MNSVDLVQYFNREIERLCRKVGRLEEHVAILEEENDRLRQSSGRSFTVIDGRLKKDFAVDLR